MFARTAVLEEYARWLACERAVTIDADGSVTVHAEAVAALAELPVDPFEENWVQTAQPAFAVYLRCCDYLESLPADGERAATWLTDLRAYSRRFGRCGQLAVDAAIDSMVNSDMRWAFPISSGVILGFRPPLRPRARAAASPA